MFSTADTITAIATPPGHGGIGVIRISGPTARDVAGRLLDLREPLVARHATFTRAVLAAAAEWARKARAVGRDPNGTVAADSGERRAIDHVVATFFPAPHSYTGEDVVEISAHGSPIVLDAILRAAVEGGARLAEPGEFTLRAFLNGRIDLVQAEAVADLVDAVTPAQARAAFDQLEGTLTGAIGDIERVLFDLAARLEASVDFPDEGYHFITPAEIVSQVDQIGRRVQQLVREGESGRILREGRQIAIAGKPNVGKSTLFNRLLGADRAIVTPIPGTTRDLVSETTEIGGIRVCLVDTAGIRRAVDLVEREGVERAQRAASIADLVVVVLDRSRPLDDEDWDLLRATEKVPRVVVINKRDLPAAWREEELGEHWPLVVSLMIQSEAYRIREAIGDRLAGEGRLRDVPAVTNARHLALLVEAGEALGRARALVGERGDQVPEEFVLADIQDARRALEEVTGRRTSEDLLRHIFSRFCIGK